MSLASVGACEAVEAGAADGPAQLDGGAAACAGAEAALGAIAEDPPRPARLRQTRRCPTGQGRWGQGGVVAGGAPLLEAPHRLIQHTLHLPQRLAHIWTWSDLE